MYNEDIPTFKHRVINKAWIKADKTERVFVYKNDDGTWGHWGEYFSDHEAELCWCPNEMGGHFYDTEETAIKELHSSYPWSKEIDFAIVKL